MTLTYHVIASFFKEDMVREGLRVTIESQSGRWPSQFSPQHWSLSQ